MNFKGSHWLVLITWISCIWAPLAWSATSASQAKSDTPKEPTWSGPGVPKLSTQLDSNLWAYFDTNNTQGILGLSVYSQQEQKYLVDFKADSLFTPASTLKLLTTAAALDEMDLDWRPQTRLQFQGLQDKSKFKGELKLIGGGDPNLSGRYFKSAFESLDPLVQQVVDLGLDTIQGEIIADASFFKDPLRPKSWESRFYDKWYGAEVSALAFNDNCIIIRLTPGEKPGDSIQVEVLPEVDYMDVRYDVQTKKGRRHRLKFQFERDSNVVKFSGSMGLKGQARTYVLPVRQSPQYFRQAFIQALEARGVYYVPDTLSRDSLGVLNIVTPFKKTLTHRGIPLLSVMDEINQRSQNFHAETLLRQLGAEKYGEASIENGSQAVKSLLARYGHAQDTSRIRILDGSGLSYGNRITPKLMVGMLKGMLNNPRKDYYINSLAEPTIATSGKRLKELQYPWRSKYKTGFINHTQGLSGYIFTALGDTLSIALYINKYKIPDTQARNMMDSMWIKIADYYDRERPSLMKARQLHQQVELMGTFEYKWLNSEYHQRLVKFSKLLLDVPYGHGGPTGEGMYQSLETKPLINLDELDCVTFIETVMALARVHDVNYLMDELQAIRYLDSTIDFHKRRHFFVQDWVLDNPEMVKLKRFEGDTTYIRISDRSKFYGYKKLKFEGENPQTELSYLPLQKTIDLFAKPWEGEPAVLGFGLVGKLEWLWVTHTGFLILEPGKMPIMRHASLREDKVVDMDLSKYLKTRRKSLEGVMFFEFEAINKKDTQ